ncbi:MAG TPA: hypothetical protein VGC74_03110 [Stenotrophomonas sp.]
MQDCFLLAAFSSAHPVGYIAGCRVNALGFVRDDVAAINHTSTLEGFAPGREIKFVLMPAKHVGAVAVNRVSGFPEHMDVIEIPIMYVIHGLIALLVKYKELIPDGAIDSWWTRIKEASHRYPF